MAETTMRFPLAGVIRVGTVFGFGVFAFAVWLGRLDLGRDQAIRVATRPRYEVLNGFVFTSSPSPPRFLDLRTGELKAFTPPDGDRLDFASCAPWCDEQGESQLVGRWTCCNEEGLIPETHEFGIARYALPSGKVLNRVALDIVPSSHPCWFPGTSASVLYGGSDGELYVLDFEGVSEGDEPKPRRVSWACEPPGDHVMVRDPVWSRDPRLGGRLVVSIAFLTKRAPRRVLPPRLWWLSLSDDGTSIVAAAPVWRDREAAESADAFAEDSEERFPSLATMTDGSLALAYLLQFQAGDRWQLRLVSMEFDFQTGAPLVDHAASQPICERHRGEAARFSADGGSLFALTRDDGSVTKVVRYPTSLGTLANRTAKSGAPG